MKRVLIWLAAFAGLALVAWAALHVLISPVHPDQAAPEGHVTWSCWACHIVTDTAELR